MNLLYVSGVCSKDKYNQIQKMRTRDMIDPQQKFNRLILDGLKEQANVHIDAMSALPVSASSVKKRMFFKEKEDVYTYLGFINGKILRYITIFINSFIYAFCWCLKTKGEKVIIADALEGIASSPARIAGKLFGVKSIAVVTDMPTLSTNMKNRKESFFKKYMTYIYQNMCEKTLKKYDAYIVLTNSIDERVNENGKPCLVIEGLADAKDILDVECEKKPYVLYAGGVFEKFGVKNLVEGFLKADIEGKELHIYGSGTYVAQIEALSKVHKNIKYMGCIPPEEVVEREKEAELLVNPRPTDEEFSKYSFPSKTMEYMLSGTPFISTRLPGIPEEYFNYIYSFDDETVSGMADKLLEVFSYPKEERINKAQIARQFVLDNKNNIIQAKKILDFAENIG